MKVSIDKINQTIAKWLYGDGKKIKTPDGRLFWETKNNSPHRWNPTKYNFHEDYNLLMEAFEKILSVDGNWYAVYNTKIGSWKGRGKNKKWEYDYFYYCAFTTDGNGRMGYGKKLDKDFFKQSIILAMHYSLYRFIKNGLEY